MSSSEPATSVVCGICLQDAPLFPVNLTTRVVASTRTKVFILGVALRRRAGRAMEKRRCDVGGAHWDSPANWETHYKTIDTFVEIG